MPEKEQNKDGLPKQRLKAELSKHAQRTKQRHGNTWV